MNLDLSSLIMIIGLLLYLGGLVGLYFYTIYLVTERTFSILGKNLEINKDSKLWGLNLYDMRVGGFFAYGIFYLSGGIVLLTFLSYMIFGLIGAIVIFFLLIVLTKFLAVDIRKKLKKFVERKEELKRKNIQQLDESIIQKLSKEK